MSNIIKELWTSAPADIFDRVKRRANRWRNRDAWRWEHSLEWVLKRAKHMDPKGHIERWERYWRTINVNGGNELREKFDFKGKSVMELGCGPLLGFGPIALFNGAKKFGYHEPGLAREVVKASQIKTRLFAPMFEELVANYGAKMSFESWYERVIHEAAPVDLNGPGEFDLFLSNSVLEHVLRSEMSQLLRQLRRLSGEDGWFYHAVDFGPHDSSGGLQKLYEKVDHQTPDDKLINLLRLSEVEKELEAAGFDIMRSTAYKFDTIDRRYLHESWSSLSPKDLGTRVAIIIGKCAVDQRVKSSRPSVSPLPQPSIA